MIINRILFIIIFTMVGLLQVNAENAPKISFDKTVVDFGVISIKTPRHKAVFKFKNIGNSPLIITRVRASCGCTTPTFSGEPIMPGKTGNVTVEYNGTNRALGAFNKTIYVYTNDPNGVVRLFIRGEMKRESKR